MNASHHQVAEEIESRIRVGAYAPGQMLTSERQLAEEFGVGRAVVRNAIVHLVRSGVLTQLPNCRPVVAALRKENARGEALRRIAVWIRVDDDSYGEIAVLRGIRSRLEESGYGMVVGLGVPDLDGTGACESRSLADLLHSPVAGTIVWETCDSGLEGLHHALTKQAGPIVFVDREPFEEIVADIITTNNRRGARKAVEHLLSLGHRRIALVTNDEPVSSVRDRILGYEEALVSIFGEAPASLLFRVSEAELGHSGPTTFAAIARQMRSMPEPPTAVFCVNDGIAFRMLQGFEDMGVRVPEEISVVGFDWTMRIIPSGGCLTTVAQPFEAIGRLAAARLIDRIEGDDGPSQHIALDAPLVIRSTTGAAPDFHSPPDASFVEAYS